MNDKIVKIQFNIWANEEKDATELQQAIFDFIDWFGERGIKVTASKIREAISMWDKNAFVKSKIVEFLNK